MPDLRLQLIEGLCRLPDESLSDVEAVMDRLEHSSISTHRPDMSHLSLTQPQMSRENWPHAPLHRFSEHGTFVVTASTL
jgi:hypothetical protein